MSENKQGWIRHRGGKMPSTKGKVEVRLRCGEFFHGSPEYFDWSQSPGVRQIMAYRLVDIGGNDAANFDPMALRDRYKAVDQQIADKLHEVAVLKDERVSILDALKSEGFARVGV